MYCNLGITKPLIFQISLAMGSFFFVRNLEFRSKYPPPSPRAYQDGGSHNQLKIQNKEKVWRRRPCVEFFFDVSDLKTEFMLEKNQAIQDLRFLRFLRFFFLNFLTFHADCPEYSEI